MAIAVPKTVSDSHTMCFIFIKSNTLQDLKVQQQVKAHNGKLLVSADVGVDVVFYST